MAEDPGTPVANEEEKVPAVRAPATAVTPAPCYYDDSHEQQQQQQQQQGEHGTQPPTCSDGGDVSHAPHAKQGELAIRARVLDWVASRPVGSWVR